MLNLSNWQYQLFDDQKTKTLLKSILLFHTFENNPSSLDYIEIILLLLSVLLDGLNFDPQALL